MATAVTKKKIFITRSRIFVAFLVLKTALLRLKKMYFKKFS